MGYGPVKSDRSLIGWLLLSIVTCGIYSYYFLYCLARDINTMCQEDGDSTPGIAAFILLSFVTCGFYALYWYYKIGNRLQANAPRYGLVFQENGTTILMWQIVGALLCGLGLIFAHEHHHQEHQRHGYGLQHPSRRACLTIKSS